MRNTTVSRLLTQLGAAVGMPDLAFDPNGQCHLLIDGQYLVQIFHHPREHIVMSCPFGPENPDTQQLSMLLQSNFGQVAGGIVMAQTPDGRPCAQASLPCDSAQAGNLIDLLEALINEAERWNNHFTQCTRPSEALGSAARLMVQTV